MTASHAGAADRGRTAVAVVLAVLAAPEPARAHTGHCAAPEVGGTLATGLLLVLLVLFPHRRKVPMKTSTRLSRLALPVGLVLAATVTACGGKASTARPSTTARLQIVAPGPNAVAPPDLNLVTNLVGARVVPASQVTGKLRGDEGHIHVSLDGRLVSMAYGTTQDLHGLKPGPHTLQAEFVAVDHQPFANRVVAAVLFQVQG